MYKCVNEIVENSPRAVQTPIQNTRRTFRRSTAKETTKGDDEIIKTAFLEALYNDNSNVNSLVNDKTMKCKTITENVELFELETHLTLADQWNNSFIQSKIPTMISNVENGRFIACEKLLKENCCKETDLISSCDITESEMVQCCKKVETILDKSENLCDDKVLQSFKSPPQSPHKKSIVEAILEDFCSSPYTSPICTPPEQRYINYLERTPRFKLLHKPTRVYGKPKKATVKIELAHENLQGIIDNESANESDSINSLASSPLSIQDDIQLIKDKLEILVPDSGTSQPLYDNLLHLSNYFTQNTKNVQSDKDQIQDNVLPDNDMFPIKLSGQLLEQIVALKNQYSITYNRNDNSSEEFLGFTSGNDLCLPDVNTSLDDTIIEPKILKLPTECLQSPDSSLVYENLNEDISPSPNNRCIEAPNPDHKQTNGKKLEKVDDDDYVIRSTKHWFENDDDDDFFATFTTQDVVLGSTKNDLEDSKSKKPANAFPTKLVDENNKVIDNFVGFKTANGNNVCISEESKKRVENLLKDLNMDDDVLEIENHLKTMKSKYLTKRTTGEDKQKLPQQRQTTIITAPMDSKNDLSECNYFSGFKTAKGHAVNISEKAKKTVEHILRECELKDDFNELLNLKQKIQMSHKTKCSTPATAIPNTPANVICDEVKEKYENQKNETNLSIGKRMQSTARRKYSIDNSEIPSSVNSSSNNMNYMNKSTYREEQQPEQKQQQQLRRLTINGDEFDSQREVAQDEDNDQECKQIITRKNLLSLSKKNKRRMKKLSYLSVNNINNNNISENVSKMYDDLEEYRTPLKNVQNELYTNIKKEASSSSVTPNMQEFFSQAVQTSTPFGVPNNGQYKEPQQQQHKQQQQQQRHQDIDEMDSGLKPIPWTDNNNDSTLICSSQYSSPSYSPVTLSCSDKSNCHTNKTLTAHSQQHTLRERLLLLEMYGDAPNLSPIVLRNQQQHQQQEQPYKVRGRTYGLKRPRNNSLLRKT